MKIRNATIEDMEILNKINFDHFNEEIKFYDNTLNNQWAFSDEAKDSFADFINSATKTVLVAEEDNKIIGYLFGEICGPDNSRTPKKITEIRRLFLNNNYRNQGIGSRLIEEFFKWSKEQNADRTRVIASFKNTKGINFYKKHGFEDYEVILEKYIK